MDQIVLWEIAIPNEEKNGLLLLYVITFVAHQ